MKRLLLVTLLVAVWCGLSVAEPVTQQQALQKAQQFRKGKTFKIPQKVARIPRKGVVARGEAAYYIFNATDNAGFVIVSGDDRTEPILGYSDSGQIDSDNMPKNLQAWLDGYAEQISTLDNDLNVRKASLTPRTAIEPLISTKWAQSGPYNQQCPKYEGNLCVTGCVATAMAQVMYYHKWPQEATTTIPAYYTRNIGIHLDELPATTFKWEDMKDTYEADETGDGADAVAKLMRYCGQSVMMDYSPSSSGAYTSDLTTALATYFGYSKAARLVSRSHFFTTEWEDMIYKEISENRPVLYSGSNFSAGHEFVCDGCDAEGLFHINWGWGGKSDGYFVLSLLNPYDKGIGGGTSQDGFTVGQDAIIGLEPDRGQELPDYAKTANVYRISGNYTRSSKEENFKSFYLRGEVTGDKHCQVECGWGLFDAKGNFVTLLGSLQSLPLHPNFWIGFEQSVSFGANLEDGDYFIYMVYSADHRNYAKCVNADNYPITASISGNEMTLKSEALQQNLQVNSVTFDSNNNYKGGTPQTVTLNLTNLGHTHEQTLYVWLDGIPIGVKSAYLDNGETDDLSITFIPMKGMEEATLKISTDSFGENVVFSEELNITSDGQFADGDLFVSKTKEGVAMTFKVISAADKTCQLGVGGKPAIDWTTEGTVTIPDAPEGFKIMMIADGVFMGCSNLTKIVFNPSIADARPTTSTSWFNSCSSLESIEGLEYVNTSEVSNMSNMFYNCIALTSLNVSNFNTGKVTNMCCLFYNCNSLNSLDLSNFNTSNVYDMRWMFWGCSGLTSLNVSSFNTSKVTSMYSLFCNCSSLTSLDVSNFDTSNVTEMCYMFNECYNLTSLNLSSFNTSNVTDMSSMFSRCYSLTALDLSTFDTSNVTDMGWMFDGCSSLTSLDVSSFNTSKVTFMYQMFAHCAKLTSLDISNFVIDEEAETHYMFTDCGNLTITLPKTLTKIDYGMFQGANSSITIISLIEDPLTVALYYESFTSSIYEMAILRVPVGTKAAYQAADGWNNFQNIFEMGEPIILPYAEFDESTGTLTFAMGEKEIGGNVYSIYDYGWYGWLGYYEEIEMENGIYDFVYHDNSENIKKVVFDSSFADARPTTTSSWFDGCNNLQTIDGIENLNTSKVKSMYRMFSGCSSLTSLDLSGFDASNADMHLMFYNCSGLTTITLPTALPNDNYECYELFNDCNSLSTIITEIDDPTAVLLNDCFFANSIYSNVALVVPVGTKTLYKQTQGWNKFKNIFEVGEPVIILHPYAEFDESTGTLTFATSEMNLSDNMYEINDELEWLGNWDNENGGYDNAPNILKVVFDASFSLFMPEFTNLWFGGCYNLQSIEGMENLNTSNVVDMWGMFYGCSSLTSLDLSNFDTSNVVDMRGMFYGCSSLTSLDLSNFDTSNVGQMEHMFSGCNELTRLVLPSQMSEIWETIVYGCGKLETITSLIENPSEVWVDDDAFDENTYAQATLYVPAGTKALYQEADGWKNFMNIVEMSDVSVTLTKEMVTFTSNMPLDFSSSIDGLSAYVVTTVNDEGKAVLKKVTGTVPVGMGIILLGTAGQTYTIPCTTKVTAVPKNLLVGVTTDTAIGGNNTDYILKDGKFVKANAGALSGGKAYLRLDVANVREIVYIDGETTGINEVVSNGKATYYNLNGQRVSSPKRGDINIVNGKKTIVK